MIEPMEFDVAYLTNTGSGYIEIIGFVPLGTNSNDIRWPCYADKEIMNEYGYEAAYVKNVGSIDDYLIDFLMYHIKKLKISI